MIKFTSLVAAIQGAVEQASHAVAHENIKLLKTYFHSEKSSPEGSDMGSNGSSKTGDQLERLIPRMVVMKYPKETASGPSEHEVMVPLISLSPISNLHMSSVTVEMDLEIVEKDNKIMVGFPSSKKSLFGGNGNNVTSNAKVTVNLNADATSPGLTAIIEGYDKALRAQIPS